VLAIDPGNVQSAWLIYDGQRPTAFGIWENDMLRGLSLCEGCSHVAIETMHSRGMPTAQEEFDTQFWAGRFVERLGLPFTKMRRLDVKMHLCGSARAKDGNIRQVLLDRYGGEKAAKGNKKAPGPLYGISRDCWSALALAVTWWETIR